MKWRILIAAATVMVLAVLAVVYVGWFALLFTLLRLVGR